MDLVAEVVVEADDQKVTVAKDHQVEDQQKHNKIKENGLLFLHGSRNEIKRRLSRFICHLCAKLKSKASTEILTNSQLR